MRRCEEGSVVIVGATGGFTVKAQPDDDLQVLGRRELVRVVRAKTETLDTRVIDAILAAARRSTTWQP